MNKVVRFLIIDILLFSICILGIYQIFNKAGLNIPLNSHNGYLFVEDNITAPNGVKLQIGDKLDSINQIPVTRIEDVEYLCERSGIGRQVLLSLQKNGNTYRIEWPLTNFYSISYLILIGFMAIVYFSLALLVLIKAKQSPEATIFHWLAIAIAVLTCNRWGVSAPDTFTGLSHIGRISYAIAYAFIPFLFLHFSQIFPSKAKKYIPEYILYPVPGLLAFWLSVQYYLMQQLNGLSNFHSYLTVVNIIRGFFIVITIAAILQFILSYRDLKDESERRKLRWIFFGLLVGTFSFMFLWQFPQIFFSRGIVDEKWMFVITLIIPITFAISIIRYHILDIDLIIRRSTVYFIVIGLMVILYTAIVTLVVFLAGTLNVHISIAAMAISAVLIGLLFEPVKRYLHRSIDKKFFRMRYNFQKIQEAIIQKIKNSLRVEDVGVFIAQELDNVLHPENLLFLLHYPDTGGVRTITSLKAELSDTKYISELIGNFKEITKPVVTRRNLIEPGIDCHYLDGHALRHAEISLLIPIPEKSNIPIGWIAIGKKKSGQIYTREDIELLNSIAIQAGLAITRLELQKELLLKVMEVEHLQQLNEMKSYFVSSVSHELQTPLTSIKMFAEMLRLNPNLRSPQRSDYLEIIEHEANRLAAMIKNILDFSKIERGILHYHPQNIDLIKTIQHVLKQLHFQLKADNFTVEVEHKHKQVPLFVDENGLQSCLLNLISNAIKYSINKKYLGVFTDISDRSAIIKIQDHGIGIKPEEQNRIFNSFFRSTDQRVQSRGGAGLGLQSVQHFVLGHKGKIDVISTPGKGSIFSISLPLGTKHAQNLTH